MPSGYATFMLRGILYKDFDYDLIGHFKHKRYPEEITIYRV